MKVYISADIEGVTGITDWDETEKSKADYERFAKQMTREVAAACEGAINGGADEIWVKDAHDSGRNIDVSMLPKQVKLIRGWSGHPFSMVQELDESFDALIFIGYHSAASSDGNPLAHTMNPSTIKYLKINGVIASEFLIHACAAAYVGVPVVFISGDKLLTEEVKKINNNISVLAVNEGIGNSTISIHPDLAVEKIENRVKKSLDNIEKCKMNLPQKFVLEIGYYKHFDAYKASFYPGMKQTSSNDVTLETEDYFDVLRAILFLT